MTLWRFCPAACLIRLTNSLSCFSATIPIPPNDGGRASRPSIHKPRQNDSSHSEGETPALQTFKLPAPAGAPAAGTASPKPPKAPAAPSEASSSAVSAASPSASEQQHPEQDLAQRGE